MSFLQLPSSSNNTDTVRFIDAIHELRYFEAGGPDEKATNKKGLREWVDNILVVDGEALDVCMYVGFLNLGNTLGGVYLDAWFS